jgi:glucose-6-phosphate-specific signal transduction histidine kinase
MIAGCPGKVVRFSLSKELRPPSLDDIGLLATIGWLCREVESICPEIHVDKEFLVNEDQIPKLLKIVIYRILQEILGDIGLS